ncbi:protein ELYS isoform X2 [Ooceraea biroi]|uniref:protein ELYS isoform X2 n=1 Tax=Ooceraea biroi TaxID=2015173 RepID=UPI000F07F6CB|nr:protein ELYS isoform X2 [Ooceraea biroi]
MKELEEVSCEIRRIVQLQFSVSNRLRYPEAEEHGQSAVAEEHNNVNNYRGGFLHNATYAWLSYGCHLVVFNVKLAENISSWRFRGVVTSVSQFPAQPGKLPLLLVGVDNFAKKLKDSFGLLCIFDCTVSRVLRAIQVPCGIEQVCIVSGGAEWEEFNDKRPDNILSGMDGIACVTLRNLQHIMVDLRRSTWDTHDLFDIRDETLPAEIYSLSEKQIIGRHQSNQEKHATYNLLDNRIERHIGFNREKFESCPLFNENLTTAIISSTKIGCSILGCLGRIIIWQNDGSLGWISKPLDESMTVTHLALLEPTDDPRPFYYLWAVFQDESSNVSPVLRMYAMLFERKYCDRGMNLYFNLEADPSLKFESELGERDKVISLCTVERESNPEQTESGAKRGEDNLLLIATNDKVLLFDLNQWYKEQMPRTVNECQNPNSILALYRTQSDAYNVDNQIVNFAYVPMSLQEFPSNGPSSPEELFYPNSLSLEWVELSSTKLTFWMTRGIQADLLREMTMVGPSILLQPSETFHRCLSAGLVPFNSEFSFGSDQNAQREMLLSLCLEQRWSTFLVKCAMEWSDGSASYLYPTFLKWGVQRASEIKIFADRLCVPLFDQSGSSIGEADVKTLRFCSQQLECLSSVVGKLPFTTTDLMKQRRTLERVSTYFQVLIWFYDVGLLPETQDLDEGALPISLALKVPYPYEKLLALYKEKRAQVQTRSNNGGDDENDGENFFIDELITRECSKLKAQWEREGGTATGGCYPPPSLQSLLRSYLTDCHQTEENETSCKHQITIYLLMDLAMLLQRSYPAVDQLIKYPSAFKMSPSLIKLTQAFWLLDHEDYQGFLDMMTGQLISDFDVKDWHHRLILRTLIRNSQHKLALVYLRVRKPPLSSMEEQGVAVSLSVEHGLVQSAFHRRPPCHYEQLLTCFFQACKKYGKLDEILHLALDFEEEEMFVKFLEENKTQDLQMLYYLQRCRYTEAISGYPIRQYQSSFTKNMQSTSLSMLGAYNDTLPDVTKRFTTNAAATDMDLEAHYPRPMSHCKSHDKLRSIHETVITKARETYLRGEKCQIPFVSAPCMSLKLSNRSANMNCVLFPTLVCKSYDKRTVDQIYEGEEANHMSDSVKRRKLSDGTVSPSKADAKGSGLTTAFETPLVKRKLNTSTSKGNVSETPQSILKIRQLIRSSTSPSATTSQSSEVADLGFERDKKVSRQIRFNISQTKKALTYLEEGQEEEKEDSDKSNASRESKDAFFSPEASNKTHYSESAVLSSNSSLSNKSYCCPRPRRSLRRSALQSSVELLQEESAKKASDSFANPVATVSQEVGKAPFDPNISSRRSSLVSEYSNAILSLNSSVDDSYSRGLDRTSSSLWRLSMEKDRNNKFAISSTPLTKRIVSQTRVNDENVMRMDDDEENTEDSLVSDMHNAEEELGVPSEFKKSSYIELPDYNRSDFKESQNNVEKDVQDLQDESEESEDQSNNGSIAKEESPNLQNPHEKQNELLEFGIPELSPTVSDESDEELLQLQINEESNDEHEEEVFESLSTTPEDVQLEDVFVSRLSDQTWKPTYKTEEHATTKSNGLQEPMQVIVDVDFTDDESSRDVIPTISNEADNERKEKGPTIHSENVFHEILDITDDESDSSSRESEEQKARNGRISSVQEQRIMQNVEMETKDESNKTSRKSTRRESIAKKDVHETPSQSDNKSSTQSSYKAGSSRPEIVEKSTRGQTESKNDSSVRMTRSRRASSLAKDTAADTTLRQADSERVTRQRRGSSMVKDATTDSPPRSVAKRSRRASSTAKEIISSLQDAAEKPSRLRRMTDSPIPSSHKEHPETPPRLRRVIKQSPTTKDIRIDSPKRPRGRRASSLAKDVLMSSVVIDEDLRPVTPSEPGNSDVQPSVRRGRRSTSVVKEILQTEMKDSDTESVKDELPVRRSARLTSSAKRTLMDVSKNLTRSESASSLSKLTSDEEEEKGTRKRSLRARKSSASSDTDKATTSKSLRSSKTDLEVKELEPKINRRRGSSMPKEITTGRRSRSSSIIKEIIPEVTEPPPEESRRLRSSTAKNTDEHIRPATRRRSASILSIPEELEEILSPSKEKKLTRSETRSSARERRARSADVLHKEVKRRTRATSIAESIAEEPAESKDMVEVTQDAPEPRRKTAPTAIVELDRIDEKELKGRRPRQRNISRSQESSSLFSFSQPENTDDAPIDEKGIGEVPKFVFSPPQTRSRTISPNQHQK